MMFPFPATNAGGLMLYGVRFEVALRFVVQHDLPPPSGLLHDALEHVQAVVVEAETQELAEHYVDLVRLALERQADRS